jgi:hypothetical protein
MLDGNDKSTFHALRLLRDIVDRNEKPLIIWAGAGVSNWRRYPTWRDTADQFHSDYLKFERSYDAAEGFRLITSGQLPRAFDVFRNVNKTRYRDKLASVFGPRGSTEVYDHFLKILTNIVPHYIITTNVDECLERGLVSAATVQKSDLEQCLNLVGKGQSFVAKLHGSISSIDSVVFTANDYERLLVDADYMQIVRTLFSCGTVVFIGYSLRDKYVLDLFTANLETKHLFGDGPHFVVQSSDLPVLPASINAIRYVPEPHTDHRSAIMVLDVIRSVRAGGHVGFPATANVPHRDTTLISGYLITDTTPPGTWTSSQTLTFADAAHIAIVGQGFVENELPQKESPALHDLAIGLISFDRIYAPLSSLGRLHDLLGSELFWILVRANTFHFVYFQSEPAVIFPESDAASGGEIAMMGLSHEGGEPLTVDEQIRKLLKAVPGKEAAADALFVEIESRCTTFDHKTFNIPNLTRGALVHPSIQRLLGISDAVLPTSFPRWATFPVIRLAHTIMAGCTCESLMLPATKIAFGGEILVGAAFAVAAVRDWADSVTSYVLTGSLTADMGAYIYSNPSAFQAILKFRDTQAGVDLRKEILGELATNSGAEFVASVDAGLNRILPSSVTQIARDELSALMLRSPDNHAVVPAVWTSVRNSDLSVRLWRTRSRQILREYCSKLMIGDYDQCPCGSGEKLRFCCAQALKD